MLDWARPVRIPLAVFGAAAAVAVLFARSAGQPSDRVESAPTLAQDDSNTQTEVPSDAQPNTQPDTGTPLAPDVAPNSNPGVAEGTLAVAPKPDTESEMFPQPEPGEAEIRRIEFGGRSGTISQVEGSRGTTTVIWVNDELPIDSERSL